MFDDGPPQWYDLPDRTDPGRIYEEAGDPVPPGYAWMGAILTFIVVIFGLVYALNQ